MSERAGSGLLLSVSGATTINDDRHGVRRLFGKAARAKAEADAKKAAADAFFAVMCVANPAKAEFVTALRAAEASTYDTDAKAEVAFDTYCPTPTTAADPTSSAPPSSSSWCQTNW